MYVVLNTIFGDFEKIAKILPKKERSYGKKGSENSYFLCLR
jgi:hypothetical protein